MKLPAAATPDKDDKPVVDTSEIDFDASHLMQFVPKYEEIGIIDIKEHDPKPFALFLEEI